MTSKEALEELKIYLPAIYSEVAKCLDTIKQDLERLEQLEKENQDLRDKLNSEALDNWQLHCKYGEYKKAIEIFKDKVGFIFHIDDDNKYYFSSKYLCNEITKEEYDLLNEVLGNE